MQIENKIVILYRKIEKGKLQKVQINATNWPIESLGFVVWDKKKRGIEWKKKEHDQRE